VFHFYRAFTVHVWYVCSCVIFLIPLSTEASMRIVPCFSNSFTEHLEIFSYLQQDPENISAQDMAIFLVSIKNRLSNKGIDVPPLLSIAKCVKESFLHDISIADTSDWNIFLQQLQEFDCFWNRLLSKLKIVPIFSKK